MQTDPARSRSEDGFFVGWVLQSTAGALIGVFMAGFWGGFTGLSDHRVPEECLLVPFSLLLGVSGGSLQALALRRFIPAARQWVLASVLGSLVSMGAISLLNNGILNGQGNIGVLADAAVFGTIVGLCQGVVFRHPRWAATWVVASAVGCAVAAGSTVIAFGSFVFLLIAPLPYSITTGLALIALMRSSSPEALNRTISDGDKPATP